MFKQLMSGGCPIILFIFIVFPLVHGCYNMSLTIPKGEEEFVNLRRTNNKMATRKRTKGQKRSKNIHIKLNIE